MGQPLPLPHSRAGFGIARRGVQHRWVAGVGRTVGSIRVGVVSQRGFLVGVPGVERWVVAEMHGGHGDVVAEGTGRAYRWVAAVEQNRGEGAGAI